MDAMRIFLVIIDIAILQIMIISSSFQSPQLAFQKLLMREQLAMAITLLVWVVACCKGCGIGNGMRSLSNNGC
jgi:hypothetical protein